MKKTVVVCVVIVSLVAALCYTVDYALEDKGVRATKQKIKILRIAVEEQRLLRDFWQYKVETTRSQAMFAPRDPNSS